MSIKLYKLTVAQLNVVNWDNLQTVNPADLVNYPSLVKKIGKCRPIQICKFLKYNLSIASINAMGMNKVKELIKIAGERNIKDIMFELPEYMFYSTFQWDLTFISTYANVLDLSHVYTQNSIPNSFLKNYFDRIDVVSALQYFYIRQPERLKPFIDSNREKIQDAIDQDINSERLCEEIFSEYGLKKACQSGEA